MSGARFYINNPNAPKPNKPNHIGVVALIEKDNKVLLEQRTDSGKWAFIGGGVHLDESLLDALNREVKEETGLTIKNVKIFGTYSSPSRIAAYPDGNVLRIISIVYKVEVMSLDTILCSEESLKLSFFSKEELPGLDIAETHVEICFDYISPKDIILK